MKIFIFVLVIAQIAYVRTISKELRKVKHNECPEGTHYVFTKHTAIIKEQRGFCIQNKIHNCVKYDEESGSCTACDWFYMMKKNKNYKSIG